MESEVYTRYQNVCMSAVRHPHVFESFKSNTDYTYMLEHVSREEGVEYAKEIKAKWPLLVKEIDWVSIQKLDSIGCPNVYDYRDLFQSIVHLESYQFSPTTLRYVFYGLFILSCQSKKSLNVIEIGGGHGGQCYVIHALCQLFGSKINSYTIVDIPHVIQLQKKCLDILNTPCFYLDASSYKTALSHSYDLCVSNYALGELPESIQTDYIETIVKKSAKHFFVWNLTPIHSYFTDRERIHTYLFVKEKPATGPSVVIFN